MRLLEGLYESVGEVSQVADLKGRPERGRAGRLLSPNMNGRAWDWGFNAYGGTAGKRRRNLEHGLGQPVG